MVSVFLYLMIGCVLLHRIMVVSYNRVHGLEMDSGMNDVANYSLTLDN